MANFPVLALVLGTSDHGVVALHCCIIIRVISTENRVYLGSQACRTQDHCDFKFVAVDQDAASGFVLPQGHCIAMELAFISATDLESTCVATSNWSARFRELEISSNLRVQISLQ